MKQKGFTIAELLVVLSIIGVLASVALVSVQGEREKARQASIDLAKSSIRNAHGIPTNSMSAFWDFEGVLYDKTGQENDGDEVGSLAYVSGVRDGRSADFGDGSTGRSTPRAEVPHDDLLNLPPSFGVSFWAYPYNISPTTAQYILWKKRGEWSMGAYHCAVVSNSIRCWYAYNPPLNLRVEVQAPVMTNEWTHVVWTREGGVTRLYLNGAVKATNSSPETPKHTDEELLFGTKKRDTGTGGYDFNGHFNGKVDDIAVYQRGLTPQDIQDLYGGGP